MASDLTFPKKIRPFWLHADAIYSFPQKVRVDGVSTRYDNYLNYDLGAEYFLPHSLNLLFEVNGFLQGDMKRMAKNLFFRRALSYHLPRHRLVM